MFSVHCGQQHSSQAQILQEQQSESQQKWPVPLRLGVPGDLQINEAINGRKISKHSHALISFFTDFSLDLYLI